MRSYSPRAIDGPVAPDYSSRAPSSGAPARFVSGALLGLHLKRSAMIAGLLCVVFTIAAVVSFPEADDASLLMILRELGSKGITNGYPDNPVASQLWASLVDLCGVYFWPMAMLLNSFLWACFALTGSFLWIRMFPEHHEYAPFVGCLTIAPVVIDVQRAALTISTTAVLSSILGYIAVFLMLRHVERLNSGLSYSVPCVLAALAVWFHEYNLSIGLVVFTLLLCSAGAYENLDSRARAWRSAWVSLAVMVASYVIYRIAAHPAAAHDMPSASADLLRRIESFFPNVVSSLWHAVIGAYGALIGSLYLSWGSKTSFLSFACGILLSWVLASNRITSKTETLSPKRSVAVLLAVLFAGLAPAVFRHALWVPDGLPRENETISRFFVPVMPVAACLTTFLCLGLIRSQFRPIVISVVTLLIGYTSVNQVWSGFRRQHLLANIGSAVKPSVDATSGYVVGVLSTNGLCLTDAACTMKVSATWPVDVSRRFWLYPTEQGVRDLGARDDCKSPAYLNAGYRGVQRKGTVASSLWIETSGDRFRIEPYCLADRGSTLRSAASPIPAVPMRAGKGLLTGSFENTSGVQDLTRIGTLDWSQWTSASVSNHKSSGGSQVYYYGTVGKVSVRDGVKSPVAFTWSDGTPTEAATDVRSGIFVTGEGHGFEIAAPADLMLRTLIVYIGARKAQGKVQVKLTDSSVDDYLDTSFASAAGGAERMYKFVYRAGSPQQHLIFRFTLVSSNPEGEISLQAAALSGSGT